MQKSQEAIDAELNNNAVAFNRDPETWLFRQYWQAQDLRFIELTTFIDQVVTGKTIVSNEIIAQCKEAVLQINQITHVLTELSKGVGQTNLVSAMNIAYTYDARATAARGQLQTIASWQSNHADAPSHTYSIR